MSWPKAVKEFELLGPELLCFSDLKGPGSASYLKTRVRKFQMILKGRALGRDSLLFHHLGKKNIPNPHLSGGLLRTSVFTKKVCKGASSFFSRAKPWTPPVSIQREEVLQRGPVEIWTTAPHSQEGFLWLNAHQPPLCTLFCASSLS